MNTEEKIAQRRKDGAPRDFDAGASGEERELGTCPTGGQKLPANVSTGMPERHSGMGGNRSKENDETPLFNPSGGCSFALSPRPFQIFLTGLSGKTNTLNVSPSSTIADVRLMIQDREAIPPENQRITYNEKDLDEDGRTLADYGIQPESTLHLHVRWGKSCGWGTADDPAGTIFVKTLTEKTIVIDRLSGLETVSDIKDRIEEREGIASYQQHLIFSGKRLMNNNTLKGYGIQCESTLFLVVWLKGSDKPVLFIKTATGRIITIDRVNLKDTIMRIKARIERVERIPLERQRLIFAGSELENDKTLEDYGIQYESTFHLFIKPSNRTASIQTLFVRTILGRIITITNVNATDTVFSIKTRIAEKESIHPDIQRLIFVGKALEDNKKLMDYDIQDESTLHLVIRLPFVKETPERETIWEQTI